MKYYIIPVIFALYTIFQGCSDFLTPEPDGTLGEKEIFTDPVRARGFLNNIYNSIPGSFYSIDGAMEACISDEAKSVKLSGGAVTMTDGSMTARSFAESGTWSKYYGAIRKTTIFLENVDNATFVTSNQNAQDPTLNARYAKQYKAEAWFLRGLFYFELLKRYGGVPVLPEKRLTLEDDMANIPRSSYDDCVQYILKCCQNAADSLPTSWVDKVEMYGRANRASAYALKSRVLLYAASPQNNPSNDLSKWEAAAAAAKEVLDIPEYGLLSATDTKWNASLQIWTDIYNKEILFATHAVSNSNELERAEFPRGLTFPAAQGGEGRTHPTHDLVKAFQNKNGSDYVWAAEGGTVSPARNLYESPARDPRLGWWIYYNGIRQHESDRNPVATGIGQTSGLNKDATYTHTGYYLRKFVNTAYSMNTNSGGLYKFFVIFRYAEILLNYAEAMNEAYGATTVPAGYTLSALDALNAVRTRVGMPKFENNKPVDYENVKEGIRHERRIELCFEGHRYWDLKRWKLAEQVLNAPVHGIEITGNGTKIDSWREFEVEKRVFTPNMYLYPIPYSELLKTKMMQNEGWESPNN
ncbi:MAG: RagB/SusD family nutrient uptake outer membrane protein [Dysgonamonadaceae bacterium]|jgi:hypothetical protein|nr:RagB/SusD family nutrient uptake outer membrane protein [Dysgonamonadaceae bacterium]